MGILCSSPEDEFKSCGRQERDRRYKAGYRHGYKDGYKDASSHRHRKSRHTHS